MIIPKTLVFIKEPTISYVNIICDSRLCNGFALLYLQELRRYFPVEGDHCVGMTSFWLEQE